MFLIIMLSKPLVKARHVNTFVSSSAIFSNLDRDGMFCFAPPVSDVTEIKC